MARIFITVNMVPRRLRQSKLRKIDQFVPQTPESGSLEFHGEIPLNHYTVCFYKQPDFEPASVAEAIAVTMLYSKF